MFSYDTGLRNKACVSPRDFEEGTRVGVSVCLCPRASLPSPPLPYVSPFLNFPFFIRLIRLEIIK